MDADETRRRTDRVDADRIRHDVFYLAKDPLPFRKLNYTVPGHEKCTLYEADDFLRRELEAAGWSVDAEGVQVQAFRCDASKPKAQQYSPPAPDDPWYTAYNLWARRQGRRHPDEIIQLCAHKDSQSWVDSPGAHDNAGGTAGLLELARVLADYEPERSLRLLFCNEEHTPWTSVAAARGCRARGDDLIAVLNCDGFGARSEAQAQADEKSNGIRYTCDESRWLADLIVEMNERYGIGLTQYVARRDRPGDDDGSFVNAGYASAVFHGGNGAGVYPYYHREDDVPEHVDVDSVRRLVQVTAATVLHLDRRGAPRV
ncbi:MAG: Zn-dependent exopeptidase M28 [Candidatus Brocadiaceae bacterium]|nr:Zn-dependent exopeptidase M28 [Candidatus Brocadiaceae bacterium]